MALDVSPPLDFLLASASPRRRELLEEAGFHFVVAPSSAEEIHEAGLSPAELTTHNATLKARDVSTRNPGAWVVGADTLVYLDGLPLGKPRDLEEARATLRLLSGRTHEVVSGVSMIRDDTLQTFHEVTSVRFRELDEDIIDRYLEEVHVLDKAGSYAIQERGEWIVAEVNGSLANVIGFPVERFCGHFARVRVENGSD